MAWKKKNGVERKPQGFRRVGAIKSRRNRDFLMWKIEAGSVTVGRKEKGDRWAQGGSERGKREKLDPAG